MLKLDHLTVIAPTLNEGVAHVKDCLDLDVPFGTRHEYMGTHNHRLMLGDEIYLEIVALNPDGITPEGPRWFGLGDQMTVRADWADGRRLRGFVASSDAIAPLIAGREALLGSQHPLPRENPTFEFVIPDDGSLPHDGAAPSILDRRGDAIPVHAIPDLGARLHSFTVEHPQPGDLEAPYRDLSLDRPPRVVHGPRTRFEAQIMTPAGLKTLT